MMRTPNSCFFLHVVAAALLMGLAMRINVALALTHEQLEQYVFYELNVQASPFEYEEEEEEEDDPMNPDTLLARYFGGTPGFYHAVASGDPLPDAVIIWTRYTPRLATDEIDLEFRMAEIDPAIAMESLLDPSANPNMKRGVVRVVPNSDWIAKLDVTGLKSNTQYVYAFHDGTVGSEVGLTRTAPAPDQDVQELRYAVFTCAQFWDSFFHGYDIASTIEDLDLWIHTGDAIYDKYSTL